MIDCILFYAFYLRGIYRLWFPLFSMLDSKSTSFHGMPSDWSPRCSCSSWYLIHRLIIGQIISYISCYILLVIEHLLVFGVVFVLLMTQLRSCSHYNFLWMHTLQESVQSWFSMSSYLVRVPFWKELITIDFPKIILFYMYIQLIFLDLSNLFLPLFMGSLGVCW